MRLNNAHLLRPDPARFKTLRKSASCVRPCGLVILLASALWFTSAPRMTPRTLSSSLSASERRLSTKSPSYLKAEESELYSMMPDDFDFDNFDLGSGEMGGGEGGGTLEELFDFPVQIPANGFGENINVANPKDGLNS